MTKPLVRARDGGRRRAFDPFRVLTEGERRRHLEAYGSFLEVRNGEIDLPARRLSRRDGFFAGLEREPVRWRGDLDPEAFRAWLEGAGRPPLDPLGLFLVVIGKINESERYGVELELARFDAGREHAADTRQLYLFLEEGYHSRILAEICRTCGIELEFRKPPWSTRWLIHLVRHLPEGVRWIPVLCGEVVGCAVFQLLMERCGLFGAQPEVERRIRSLLAEIWLDEALHVAFVRARLGPRAMRLSRAMLPLVAWSLTRDVPAIGALGCSRREFMQRVRRGVELPPRADWVEPDPA